MRKTPNFSSPQQSLQLADHGSDFWLMARKKEILEKRCEKAIWCV